MPSAFGGSSSNWRGAQRAVCCGNRGVLRTPHPLWPTASGLLPGPRGRSNQRHQYAYIWADGIYLGAGLEKEKTALLCVLGAREDGEKELVAMEPGYRESTESWALVLRDLRGRGLQSPLLAIGDGVLGLWVALDEVFPTTEHQRCWNHRLLNVQAKLPKRLQPEARKRLREMAYAETQACEELRDRYVADLRAADQDSAAETVLRRR